MESHHIVGAPSLRQSRLRDLTLGGKVSCRRNVVTGSDFVSFYTCYSYDCCEFPPRITDDAPEKVLANLFVGGGAQAKVRS
jgi:hypothetical protein